MENWLALSLLAVVFWGLAAFTPKLAVQSISAEMVLIYQVTGCMLCGMVILLWQSGRLSYTPNGAAFGIASGVLSVLGSLCYFRALAQGKVSLIVSVAALYPLLTILLAFVVLKEPISWRQACGIVTAMMTFLLLAR